MSGTVEAPAAPAVAPVAARPERLLPIALIAAVAVAAFAVRLAFLARGGGLLGDNGYDDGVHYAAADALVHGRLPYRDFLFLQPPGILLVLAPFAWLGSLTTDPAGDLAARLAFLLLGGANAGLVTAICRRYGWTAAIVGGGTYAVFFPAVYGERSTLLEPVGTFAVLLAILLARHRTPRPRLLMFLAGLPLGLAVCTKVWYVVPAVVLAAFLGRRALFLLAGVATAAVVICLPFLLADPEAMLRMVVLDQLGRPRVAAWTTYRRLESILGLSAVEEPTAASDVPVALFVLSVATVAVATGLAFAMRGARLFPVLVVTCTAVVLASPSYFPHYGNLVAAPLTICVGLAAGRVTRMIALRPIRLVVAAGILAGVVVVNYEGVTTPVSKAIPAAELTPVVARVHGCVTSDDPGVLIALDVLTRDLRQGCVVWPDVTGYTYDRDDGRVNGAYVPRKQNAKWQKDLLAYLTSGAAVIPHRRGTGISAETRAALHRGGALATAGKWHVWAVDPSVSSSPAG